MLTKTFATRARATTPGRRLALARAPAPPTRGRDAAAAVRQVVHAPPQPVELVAAAPEGAPEREDDELASRVLWMPEPAAGATPVGGPAAAREHQAARVGDDFVAGRGAGLRPADPAPSPASVAGWPIAEDRVRDVEGALAGGDPLPDDVRARFEPAFGMDLGAVRVHDDPRAARAANALRADAFTSGPHVVFGADRYRPRTSAGARLLAHELTHVVQQGAARVPGLDRHNAADPRLPANQPEALGFAAAAAIEINNALAALPGAADLRQRNVPGLVAELGLSVGPLTPRHDSTVGGASIHFFPGSANYSGSVTLPDSAEHHVASTRKALWIRARDHADVDLLLSAAQITERVVRAVTEVGHTHATRQNQATVTTFEEYRARFNALFPEALFAGLSNDFDPTLTSRGPKSARARAVFDAIMARYAAFATAYESNAGGIRERVDRYLGPEGLNLLDSAGLQRLRAVFFAFAVPIPAASYAVFRTNITTAARPLSPQDRAEVDRSNDWQLLIDDHIRTDVQRNEIRNIIRTAAPPAPPGPAPVGGPPAPAPAPAPGGVVTPQDFVDSVSLLGPAAPVPAVAATVGVPLTPQSGHPNPAVPISSQVTVTPAARVVGPNTSPASPWPNAAVTGAAFTPTISVAAGGLSAQLALVNGPVGLAPAAPIPPVPFAIDDQRQANMVAGWQPLIEFNDGALQVPFIPGATPRFFGGAQRIDVTGTMPAAPFLNPGLTLSIESEIQRGGAVVSGPSRAPYPVNVAQSTVVNFNLAAPAVMPVGGDVIDIVTRLLDSAGATLGTRIVAMTIGPEATYPQVDAETRWSQDETHFHDAAPGGFLAFLAGGAGASPGLSGLIKTAANPTGPVDIHPMIERHDSAAYVTAANGGVPNPSLSAYLIAPPPYAAHPDPTHTIVLGTGAGGWRISSHPAWPANFVLLSRTPDVTLTTPRRPDAAVAIVAIHEATHLLDLPAGPSAIDSYKTEFRAYWMDGRFGPPGAAGGAFPARFDPSVPQPGPKSERANKIFHEVYDDTRLYAYCKPAYDGNVNHFREEVDSILVPDGINLSLSARIEALRARFDAGIGGGGFAAFRTVIQRFFGLAAPPPAGGPLTPADMLEVIRSRAWRDRVDHLAGATAAQKALLKTDMGIP